MNTLSMKSLPRLPSEDTSDDNIELTTPTAASHAKFELSKLSSRSDSGRHQEDHSSSTPATDNSFIGDPHFMQYRESLIALSSAAGSGLDPVEKIAAMRAGFQQVELDLYAQLAKARLKDLNIVRRSFLTAGRTVRDAFVEANPANNNTIKSRSDVVQLPFESKLHEKEPDWWAKRCHVVPMGNIIVREDDWGSIIAFTMR